MTAVQIKAICARCWLFLNPCVAQVADMTVAEMQRFIAGTFMPSESQLRALARRMGFGMERANG
jgi:hypothetical protein